MLNSLNRAVQFGKSVDRRREGGCIAFPFMYTFVNRFQDGFQPNAVPLTLANDLPDLGPVIPAGGSTEIVVTLDPDHFFKLLYIKYTAYKKPSAVFEWDMSESDGFSPMEFPDTILQYVKINVSVVHNSRYLYGTTNSFQQTGLVRPVLPVTVPAIQGNDYGWGQIRSDALLPANGALRFEIFNESAYDMVVGAMIYGMKVRL